ARPRLEGRRLLDDMPPLLIRRDDGRDHVAVGVIFARAVLGLPFSIPIRAMNCSPSKSRSSTVRALRACSLISSGLIPRALSIIARSFPREILTASSCPAVVPLLT